MKQYLQQTKRQVCTALIKKSYQTFHKVILHQNIRKTDEHTAIYIYKVGVKHARE